MTGVPVSLTVLLLGTVAIGVTATLIAWRKRSHPGAIPLMALLVGQSWWSACLIFQLQTTALQTKMLWVSLSWIGVVVIPVAWVLFALEYTGRDQYTRPPYVVFLSLLPAVTVVLALTSAHHDLLYVNSRMITRGGQTVIGLTEGPWYWVFAGYTYLLGLLGSIPLLGLVTSDAVPFREQSLALLVGTVTPWVSNLLFLGGVMPTADVDPTPIAFAISGTAYLGALTRFRLLGTSPSPNQHAPRFVFERMQEAILVVDTRDNLVQMNESAVDLFDVERRDTLGHPAEAVVPGYEALVDDGLPGDQFTVPTRDDERRYDVTTTRLRDTRGRFIGRVITLHDISEYVRQQQRLTVLNRILRHNIRTETNLIHGYVDLLGDEADDDKAALVKDRALRIEEIGRKSREVIDIFRQDRPSSETVSLRDLTARCVASVREAHPDIDVAHDPCDADLRVDSALDPVVSNVIENAARHNTNPDPYVRVDARTAADGRVRVTVTDNGPGIDDAELRALERGTETALEHVSGVGLWLIKWGTEIVGGRVEFAENRPTGTTVTVESPVRSRGHDPRR